MAYTISAHQMGVQRTNMSGLVRHEFRDVDKRDGRETAHSNELIDPNRTERNISVLYVNGKARPIEHSSKVTDELDRRLAKAGGTRTLKDGTVKKIAVRKDAAVVRDIIVQLDPAYTGDSASIISNEDKRAQRGRFAKAFHRDNAPRGSRTPYWSEQQRYLDAVVDEYAKLYGAHNLLASSIHLDETNPHMHLLVTPIDGEGRVRQESFIKAGRGKGSDLAKHDRRIRQRLTEEGYGVQAEPTGGGRSHLSVEQYKDYVREQQRLDEALSDAGITAAQRAAQRKQKIVDDNAAQAEELLKAAQSEKQAVETRMTRAQQWHEALEYQQHKLDEREKRLEAREAETFNVEDARKKLEADKLNFAAYKSDQEIQLSHAKKRLDSSRIARFADELDEQKEQLNQREEQLAEQERTLTERVHAQVRKELEESYRRDKEQLDLVTEKMKKLLEKVSDQVKREKMAQQAAETAHQAPKRTPPKRQGPPRPWSEKAPQPKKDDGPEFEL